MRRKVCPLYIIFRELDNILQYFFEYIKGLYAVRA